MRPNEVNRRPQRWFSTLIFCVSLLVPVLALAQEDIESMSFEALIETAQQAYQAEEYDRAVKYLIAANLKEPNARLLLNVAKSYEKKGDCVRALVYYRAFVRAPGAEPALVQAARDSIAAGSDCEGWDEMMSGRLLITSTPSGATVSVDGTEVGTTPLEVAGYVEGVHTVYLALEGYQPAERQVDLRPDTDDQLEVTLEEVPEEPDEPVEPEEPVDPIVVDDGGDSAPVVHYAIAGGLAAVGAGLLTVGLVTDLGIPDKYDTPRESPDISESEFDALTSDRRSAVTRATIFYVVGGILLGGGVGYGVYAVMGNQESAEPVVRTEVGGVKVAIEPSWSPGEAGVLLSGEF